MRHSHSPVVENMKIRIFFVILVWIFAVTGLVAGEEKGKMDSPVSLPSEAAGWKWDGKGVKYKTRELFEYIDGAAELYLAYGFQNVTVRRFEKSGQPPLTLEFYEMDSSEDAYGVFSFERQDEAVGVGQGSEFGGGLLRFWKGKYFVSLYADGEGMEVEAVLLKLAKLTADSIPATGPEPRLIASIPGKDFGLIDKSIRYLKSHILLNQRFFISHQNILNLNRDTETVLAQFLQEKQKVQFLLVRYPLVKSAGEAYRSFMKVYLPDAGARDRSKTEDGKWTVARQRKEYILVVFGAPTEADAEALLKATEEKLPLN